MSNGDAGDGKVCVFVSYAHADKRWLDRLQIHLKGLRDITDPEIWADTKILPGTKWKKEIRNALDRASVAVLIVSADFLASDFIRTDELPPLLRAAEEEGATILPVIAGPCLFSHHQHLAQFQAVNDPQTPLVSMQEGERESVFVRVAELIMKATPRRRPMMASAPQAVSASTAPTLTSTAYRTENFLDPAIWTRLIKIGEWINDARRSRIIGSGVQSFLVSREEYGDRPFTIDATIEFSQFVRQGEQGKKFGMNAGVLFGWRDAPQRPAYLNVLFTGTHVLFERNDFDRAKGRLDFVHLTEAKPLVIENGVPVELRIHANAHQVRFIANGQQMLEMPLPPGIQGRVGLRPWRSQMDIKKFLVREVDWAEPP